MFLPYSSKVLGDSEVPSGSFQSRILTSSVGVEGQGGDGPIKHDFTPIFVANDGLKTLSAVFTKSFSFLVLLHTYVGFGHELRRSS